MRFLHLLLIASAVLFVAGYPAENRADPAQPPAAEEPGEDVVPAPKPPPEPAQPDLTKIKLDVKAGRIEVSGISCSKEGILDFLAVVSGGREYESVLALDCKGALLHADLLALGAEPGPTDEILAAMKKNPPADGKIPAKAGTKLRLTVEWEKDGKAVSVPAVSLLLNRKTRKAVEDGAWFFTGSYFMKDDDGNNVYMADAQQALIGVRFMSEAVINFERDLGDPYVAADAGCEVNKDVVPKPGTPVKLVIQLANPPAKD